MSVNDDVLTWKNKLLDLSKKNNLINYKDTKSTTLEIVFPNFFDSFNRLSSYNTTPIFSVPDDKINDIFDEESNVINKDLFIKKYAHRLSSSQILLYNSNITPRKVLHSLYRKSSESILERGVNVLYCAFGFVRWNESIDSKITYISP